MLIPDHGADAIQHSFTTYPWARSSEISPPGPRQVHRTHDNDGVAFVDVTR